jgi:hypothetical protein
MKLYRYADQLGTTCTMRISISSGYAYQSFWYESERRYSDILRTHRYAYDVWKSTMLYPYYISMISSRLCTMTCLWSTICRRISRYMVTDQYISYLRHSDAHSRYGCCSVFLRDISNNRKKSHISSRTIWKLYSRSKGPPSM